MPFFTFLSMITATILLVVSIIVDRMPRGDLEYLRVATLVTGLLFLLAADVHALEVWSRLGFK